MNNQLLSFLKELYLNETAFLGWCLFVALPLFLPMLIGETPSYFVAKLLVGSLVYALLLPIVVYFAERFESKNDPEVELDDMNEHDQRIATMSLADIRRLSDDEALKLANITISGNPHKAFTINRDDFHTIEDYQMVSYALTERITSAHENRGDIPPRTKLYLSVDGTVIDKYGRPAECLREFIEHILEHYDCYWLTTHLRDGNTSHLFKYLRDRGVDSYTGGLMVWIKPTRWDMLKTEAIDFTRDFVWFEDQPTAEESKILEEHGALNKLRTVNRSRNGDLCTWLQGLRTST